MSALLAAEFLKLRTTRTVWALLVATLAVTALAVAGVMAAVADSSVVSLGTERGIRTVLHVSVSGGIFVLVLGVIISAGEYRQGTATDTFLTTPRRWLVIVAKLITGALAGVLFGALAASVAMGVAIALYALQGYAFPLGSSDAWSVLAGTVLYAAMFGAIGAATGSLVRNQVTAIVGWLAWLFVVETIVLGFVPAVGRWLPAAAGRALVRDPNGDLLTQPMAAAVLATYGVVIMVIAVAIERRRDA
jgi:ABC-type transport system involved in multi-copper enzyme maturation permease subunit